MINVQPEMACTCGQRLETNNQEPTASNQISMLFKGIIFDLNGVLWWDQQQQVDSWNEFARSFRGTTLSDEEFAVHVHGRNMVYTLQYLAAHPLDEDDIERLGEEKEMIYRQLCLEMGTDFKLSSGAVDLLDYLAAHQIKRTIATASGSKNLVFFIDHLELHRWFSFESIVFDDGNRAGKPAPDFYLQAAVNLDLPPSDCVVVEDSISGIQAAREAGIGHIIALGSKSKHESLVTIKSVDTVVESLAQIPRTLFHPRDC